MRADKEGDLFSTVLIEARLTRRTHGRSAAGVSSSKVQATCNEWRGFALRLLA